jgi:hypothetical protein
MFSADGDVALSKVVGRKMDQTTEIGHAIR